jgi:hypothetical protein
MACVIVGSAAMTNIRRIHHHLVEEMEAEKQAETADRVTEGTQVQQNFSFFAWLQTIWLCRKLFVSSVSCFGFKRAVFAVRSRMIALQKRPSHTGYICTLLKRSVTNYNQTQSIVKGLQDVQTE